MKDHDVRKLEIMSEFDAQAEWLEDAESEERSGFHAMSVRLLHCLGHMLADERDNTIAAWEAAFGNHSQPDLGCDLVIKVHHASPQNWLETLTGRHCGSPPSGCQIS